jgi:catechol 2,3-dioxygenase-like lactoylglutathione lyase family enzyme
LIHHVSIGVSGLDRAAAFYDAVLTPLGYRRFFEVDGVANAYGEKLPEFWIGGADAGAPGPRPEYGPDYHGAFVRDPDGNKIEACLNQPG